MPCRVGAVRNLRADRGVRPYGLAPTKNASHARRHERRKYRGSTLVYHSRGLLHKAGRRASASPALPDALSAPLHRVACSRWPPLSQKSCGAYSFRSSRYSIVFYSSRLSPPCQGIFTENPDISGDLIAPKRPHCFLDAAERFSDFPPAEKAGAPSRFFPLHPRPEINEYRVVFYSILIFMTFY